LIACTGILSLRSEATIPKQPLHSGQERCRYLAMGLLIEKGLITREEFMQKISEERAAYQRMLHKVK